MTEPSLQYVSPSDAKALVETSDALLLDIREPDEIAALRTTTPFRALPMGHVKSELATLDPERTTLVLCRSGRRAVPVAEFLAAQDFDDVRIVEGGILAWSAQLGETSVTTGANR